MSDYNEIKMKVAELIKLRDRSGKKKLSNNQRLKILNEIYDGLLFLWKQSTLTGATKGTGAVSDQLARARVEIETIKLREIQKKRPKSSPVTQDEVIGYFTEIMRNVDLSLTQRSRAAEDLAKVLSMFIDKRQIESKSTIEVKPARDLIRSILEDPNASQSIAELEKSILKNMMPGDTDADTDPKG